MAGDPISGFENGLPVYSMNVLPANIEAENYDHFPIDGKEQGRTPAGTAAPRRCGQGCCAGSVCPS